MAANLVRAGGFAFLWYSQCGLINKNNLGSHMKSRFLALIGVAFIFISAPNHASVVYTYTGNTFHYPSGIYDNTMRLSATLEFPSHLAANVSFAQVTPIKFVVTDGINVATENMAYNELYFFLSTDANGAVSDWFFSLLAPRTQSVGDTTFGMLSSFSAASYQEYGFKEQCYQITSDGCKNYNLGTGESRYVPGTWTISAVPLPAAVWLFGSGLVGLIGIARRKAA